MKQILPILGLFLFASASIAKPQVIAPTDLQVNAVSSTQINLNWTDNATNEIGYQIWWSRDGASYTQLAVVQTPNTKSYSAAGLLPATTYWFKVRAYAGGGGQSQYSNTVSATTLPKPTPTPTATATPTGTPLPTPTPTATPTPSTPSPSPTPTPTQTPIPTPTPTTSPTATVSPSPTPTPTPSPTPAALSVAASVVWDATAGDGYMIFYWSANEPETQVDAGTAMQNGRMSVAIGGLTPNTDYYFSDVVIRGPCSDLCAEVVSPRLPPVLYHTTSAASQLFKLAPNANSKH